MLNYLKSMNYFDELFFHLIVMSWLQFIRRILNALNSTTALTSSSFVNEHFLFIITITVIFIITWQSQWQRQTIHKKKNIRSQRTKPTQRATPKYTFANYHPVTSEQVSSCFMPSIVMSCNFMPCIFMRRDRSMHTRIISAIQNDSIPVRPLVLDKLL